jgi:hypothetical protein
LYFSNALCSSCSHTQVPSQPAYSGKQSAHCQAQQGEDDL